VSPAPAHLVLVAAARAGDRQAFTRLYEDYGGMVHGILLARVPRHEVADLVQEVFLKAWERLDRLRDAAAFGGWLATITRNAATDFHRGALATVELSEDLPERDRSADEAEALAVLRLVRSLPEAYRDTLVLRLVEGMTGPEIAERTGLSPGSVRVNLHRGMKLLRDRLGVSVPHA
jgi:RNA polymerase sigma-70 factor, ECF subfamily